MVEKRVYATGKRKTSVARVWLKVGGSGVITVNGKDFREYFPRQTSQVKVLEPFEVTNTLGKFDVFATIKGGGTSSQAEALRHGIARALKEYDESLKPVLKKAGYLTRDPRMKERKKYGKKGARRTPQYSKR